jgi:hypothetical protein
VCNPRAYRAGGDLMPLIASFTGGILGSLGLSMLTLVFHWLFFRPAMRDGQYFFVFFVAVPVGALLGGVTALILAYLSRNRAGAAGRLALLGGGCLFLTFVYLGWFVFSGTEKVTVLERLASTTFWFGLPLIWSGVLVRSGLKMLAGR